MDVADTEDFRSLLTCETGHAVSDAALEAAGARAEPLIPDYLNRHYWWAYIHPKAVKFFERGWLVNLILLGNYDRLARAAVDTTKIEAKGCVLQIACAYGELTPMLARKARSAQAQLHVIDILPIQLENLSRKLDEAEPVLLSCMDSCGLEFRDETFDSVLLFFLMHEQPDDVRRKTLAEAYRVLKKGGTLVLVDYGLPYAWNPFRFFMRLVLGRLEPFALDLWTKDAARWLPAPLRAKIVRRRSFFAGMYQMFQFVKR